MWAQLIEMRLREGTDPSEVTKKIRATEQPGSGLVRTLMMRAQQDPRRVYTLVVFESEQAARTREQDPRRQEALQDVRELMAEVFEGAPQFTDLLVDDEWTG